MTTAMHALKIFLFNLIFLQSLIHATSEIPEVTLLPNDSSRPRRITGNKVQKPIAEKSYHHKNPYRNLQNDKNRQSSTAFLQHQLDEFQTKCKSLQREKQIDTMLIQNLHLEIQRLQRFTQSSLPIMILQHLHILMMIQRNVRY